MASYSALLHFNGTNGATSFTNDAVGGLSFTRTGAAALTTTGAKFGSACGDFTTATNLRSTTPVSFPGDFTIAVWIKRTAYTGKPFSIGSNGAAGSLWIDNYVNDLGLVVEGTGGVIFNNAGVLGDPGTPSWKMLVLQRRAGVITLAVGSGVGGVESLGTFAYAGTVAGDFMLGDVQLDTGLAEGGPSYMYFDELLICNDTALFNFPLDEPATEFTISSGVTAALTGVAGAGAVGTVVASQISYPALLHFDGPDGSATIVNESTTGPAFATIGAALQRLTAPKFGACSLDVSTLTGGVRAATSTSFVGAFTVAGWVRRMGFTGTIFSMGQDQTVSGMRLRMANNDLVLEGYNAGAAATAFITNSANVLGAPPTAFVHVAVTRDVANVVRVFVGGQLAGSVSGTGTIVGRLVFGDFIDSGGNSGSTVAGTTSGFYLDEWIVSDNTALYTANFTPPTTVYNLPSGVSVGLTGVGATGAVGTVSPPGASTVTTSLHMNGTAGSSSFLNSNLAGPTFTAFGAAVLTAAQSKFGGIAGDFTGIGYVQSDAAMTFAADFTIAIFCKRNGTTGKVFSLGNENASGSMSLGTYVSSLGLKVEGTEDVILDGTAPIGNPGDPWRFLVLQRRAGILQLLAGDNADAVTLRGTYFFAGPLTGKLTIGDKILSTGVAEGGAANLWIDEVLVSNDTALFTAPFTAPAAEFAYYPYSGSGGGGSQTIRYLPAYGDPNRYFPVGAYEIPPGSSTATIQAELDARGTIRLPIGRFGNASDVLYIRGANKRVFGYPGFGGSFFNGRIVVQAGATDGCVMGLWVENSWSFEASNTPIRRMCFSMVRGNFEGIGSTVDSCLFLRCGSDFYFDNTSGNMAGNYTRNCRWFSPFNQGAGFGGRPGWSVKGNPTLRQNWNNVLVSYAPLGGVTINAQFIGARNAPVVGMAMEDYAAHTDGKGSIEFDSVDRAMVVGFSGHNEQSAGVYSNATKTVLLTSDFARDATKGTEVLKWGPQAAVGVALNWRSDNNGTVDLATGAIRITNDPNEQLRYNGGTTAPAGAAATAVADALVEPLGSTLAWAYPIPRTIADPAPNWATLRASMPDSRATLQAQLDAQQTGVVRITVPTCIYSTLFLNQGQTLEMSGTGCLIGRTDTFDLLGTKFRTGAAGITSGFALLDCVFYGGRSAFYQTEPGVQTNSFYISGCTFREQAFCGIGIDGSYAWDNNYAEKSTFYRCGYGVYQKAYGSTTEDNISYIDKLNMFRCDFIECTWGVWLKPTRANNLDAWLECTFKDCSLGAAYMDNGNNSNLLANCVVDNCGTGVALDSNLNNTFAVACKVTGSASNTALFSNATIVEGGDMSKGAGNAILFELQPKDAYATYARPMAFNVSSANCSFGGVLAAPMRFAPVFGNTQFPASDNPNFSAPLGSIIYDSQNSIPTGDDTRTPLLAWVPGSIQPGTRTLRDDGFLTTVNGDVAASLTGVEALGLAGSVVRDVQTALSGVAGTGAVGNLTVGGSPDVTAALTSVTGSGEVGVVGVSGASDVTVPVSGVAGTAAVGSVAPASAVALAGAAGLGDVGTVTQTGGTAVPGGGTGSAEYEMGGRYGRKPVKPLLYRVLEEKAARRAEKPSTAAKRAKSAAFEDLGAQLVLQDPTEAQFAQLAARWQALQPGPLPQAPAADAQAYFRAAVAQQLREQHAAAVAQAQAHVAALVQAEKDRKHEEDAIIALLLA